MTAVTVTIENGHTIAFLGTSDGQVLKVRLGLGLQGPLPGGAMCMTTNPGPRTFTHLPSCPQVYLAPDGSSVQYGSVLVDINKRIKQDLVLSADLASLYAMTQDKVGLGWPCRGSLWPGHCHRPRGAAEDGEEPALFLGSWHHLHPSL